MGSSALPLVLCEYFIIFYSIFSFVFLLFFSVINCIQLKIKEWLCLGGSKNPQSCCLSYYLLFRFNVMICYVWIRYRVSENMHLSVLHVKDGDPVDMCFCCLWCDTLLIFSSSVQSDVFVLIWVWCCMVLYL